MTTTIKKTFAESIAENEASKNNSDLANLASAMLNARAMEQEAQALQKRIAALAARIEGGEIVGVDEVHALYEEAQSGHRNRKRL